ncbi:MAG: DUF58 domain-containing protein [Chloroflexi bacterium]|nr:MAG: DUF58 domain-containing protein [Chloroflexota bacterium]
MILKPQWRGLLIVLIVFALLLRQGLAVMLLGLPALTLLLAELWSRWALRRIAYERSLSSERALVGDEITLTLRIANRKLLGLPSLVIDELVPDQLDYGAQRLLPHTLLNTKLLRRSTSLRPYEAVSWQIKLRCTKRGLFTFGPAHLTATDAFGLVTRELELAQRTRLLVYPELVKLPNLRLRAQHPVGERRAPRQLLTDPARTIGVRDYRRDDPLKAVHWGATARRGELQTRIFEPTTNLDIAIVLNLDTFEHYWEGVRYDQIEYMISVAAAVASEAAGQGLGFGLYTNGAPADQGQLVRIPPDRSPAQLPLVLEVLAKLVPYAVTPFPNVLRRLGPAMTWGTTIVFISAVPSEALQIALLRLQQQRGRIVWLYAGEGAVPHVPGIEVVPLQTNAVWGQRSGRIMPQS